MPMIPFKSEFGFTLVETLITMAIMTLAITPIFLTYNNLMISTSQKSLLIERMLHAHNFYYDAHKKFIDNEELHQQHLEKDPATTLIYTATKLPERSSLSKINENLYLEKITLEWKDGNIKKTDTLITYYCKPTNLKKK